MGGRGRWRSRSGTRLWRASGRLRPTAARALRCNAPPGTSVWRHFFSRAGLEQHVTARGHVGLCTRVRTCSAAVLVSAYAAKKRRMFCCTEGLSLYPYNPCRCLWYFRLIVYFVFVIWVAPFSWCKGVHVLCWLLRTGFCRCGATNHSLLPSRVGNPNLTLYHTYQR